MTDYDQRVVAGGNALYAAFPTLHEDFTAPWYYKAAEIVLNAAQESTTMGGHVCLCTYDGHFCMLPRGHSSGLHQCIQECPAIWSDDGTPT